MLWPEHDQHGYDVDAPLCARMLLYVVFMRISSLCLTHNVSRGCLPCSRSPCDICCC